MAAGSLAGRRSARPGARSIGPRPCPACRSPRSRPAFEVRSHRFRRCRGCASLFLEDPPPQSELSRLYEDERYFANPDYASGEVRGYLDYLADRGEIEQKFAQVLAHLERLVPIGRLLDVGAGPGLLLAVARSRGWDPSGLDLNPWAATYARDQLGVQVTEGSLEGAGLEGSSFDALAMMDVIEHVADADALIAEAARVTRPGGALAILTADAGSPLTRLLGRRWPEVQRAPEHILLFSVRGLTELLERNSFEPVGWHWIGKTSSLATLAADLTPIEPRTGRAVQSALRGRRLAERRFEFDPKAKFCIYARRAVGQSSRGRARPARLPKRAPPPVEDAVLEDLQHLARAPRLCDWMFDQFADAARGDVAEVGAGIGTFSSRILEAGGAEWLLLLEPEASCAQVLERRFAGDPRVRIVREGLPAAPSLGEGTRDFVLCQNVLEHIEDDAASVRAMAAALRPGGRLSLLVPAGPRLFGPLDVAYGHHRRYTKERLRGLIEDAGLSVVSLHPFNLLGVPGWWARNLRPGPRVDARALAAYEGLVRYWRPLEQRLRPPWGLSLVAHAERPSTGG